MKRRLFTIFWILSLLQCAATMTLWVRSYFNHDETWWHQRSRSGSIGQQYSFAVVSERGRLQLNYQWHRDNPIAHPDDWPPDGMRSSQRGSDSIEATPSGLDDISRFAFSYDSTVQPALVSRVLLVPHWFFFALTALLPLWMAIRRLRTHCSAPVSVAATSLPPGAGRCPQCEMPASVQLREQARPKRRPLFAILSAVSLMLCIASGLLWLGCCVACCALQKNTTSGSIAIVSQSGTLSLTWEKQPSLVTEYGWLHLTHTRRPPAPREATPWEWHVGQPRADYETFVDAGRSILPGLWVAQGPRYDGGSYPVPQPDFWTYLSVGIGYWLLVLLFGLLPAFRLFKRLRHFRGRRRLACGLCPTCGYDLRASEARCPECGTPIPADLARKPVA